MKSSDPIGALAGIGEKRPRIKPSANVRTTAERWILLGRELQSQGEQIVGMGSIPPNISDRVARLITREALALEAASRWPAPNNPEATP